MDYPNNTTNSRKHKHLNFEERMLIQVRLKDGFSPYKIAKELGRASNTIRNEIARGTVTQIKQGRKVEPYLATVEDGTSFQLLRKGYYKKSTKNGNLVLGEITSLKDSFKK